MVQEQRVHMTRPRHAVHRRACAVIVAFALNGAVQNQAAAFVSAPLRAPTVRHFNGFRNENINSESRRRQDVKNKHGFTPAQRPRYHEQHRNTAAAADAPAPEASGHADAGKEAAQAASAAVRSYRRVYDAAIGALKGNMELKPYPIPEGLEEKSTVFGRGRNKQSVSTKIMAFKAPKFRQIRAALVETDGLTHILNFVMFPDPTYDMPIFGADLVSLPGLHLICIDLQPSRPSQALRRRTKALLKEAQRQNLKALPWGGDLPEEAQKFFSPYCLWSKIEANEVVVDKAMAAVMDYLEVYLSLVADALPSDPNMVSEIRKGHAEYSNYRRENDPARGMLTRFYGYEWTEAAIDEILFDFKG